ncbi:unnamed protein product [Mytilus edulis]|uniref:Uncharacterized protein n=1 Tax=Mytilus edulis TaxID=6550 RepID=A0A8S3RTR5_MYTED|nr:unnamed protein product [Mytilus edulis]
MTTQTFPPIVNSITGITSSKTTTSQLAQSFPRYTDSTNDITNTIAIAVQKKTVTNRSPISQHGNSKPKENSTSSRPNTNGKQPYQNIDVIICNIKGIKANMKFLEHLSHKHAFICLQEHWLWTFEKDYIDKHTLESDMMNQYQTFKYQEEDVNAIKN